MANDMHPTSEIPAYIATEVAHALDLAREVDSLLTDLVDRYLLLDEAVSHHGGSLVDEAYAAFREAAGTDALEAWLYAAHERLRPAIGLRSIVTERGCRWLSEAGVPGFDPPPPGVPT